MTIHQEIEIKAKPETIYSILTTSEKFAEMTGGAPAEISLDIGGKASLFGGAIEAQQIDLVPNKRIVQAWRSKDWPEGQYSLVRFELDDLGASTKITFDQIGHPEEAQPHLDAGWHKMYWEPMKGMVSS